MLSEKMMTIENFFKVTQWSPDEFERRHPGVDPSLVSSCRSNFLAKDIFAANILASTKNPLQF